MAKKKGKKPKPQTHMRVDLDVKNEIERIANMRGFSSINDALKQILKYSETKGVNHEMTMRSMALEEIFRLYYPDGLDELLISIRQIASISRELPTSEIQQALSELSNQAQRTLADVLHTQLTKNVPDRLKADGPGGDVNKV